MSGNKIYNCKRTMNLKGLREGVKNNICRDEKFRPQQIV